MSGFSRKRKTSFVPGHLFGLGQPTLSVHMIWHGAKDNLPDVWQGERHWLKLLGEFPLPQAWRNQENGISKAAEWLLHWTTSLQRAAGLPVFEFGKVLGSPADAQASAVLNLLIPVAACFPSGANLALDAVLNDFNRRLNGERPDDSDEALTTLLDQLRERAPATANTPRFLQAAHELKIPMIWLGGEVYQFGQGARSRWLDSTFTDATPNISTRMARNKHGAASLLREAGFPVPEHRQVATAEEALSFAEKTGFPIVIKPADLDGGKGVAAGLSSPQEVREAFSMAMTHSKHILAEKHFDGRDYRLTVFDGSLLWAVERVPGGVTGDGKSSIRQLVNELNADPKRGDGPHAPLKRLIMDEEAHGLLSRAGMSESSVPDAMQFISLRRTANVARGGVPVAVTEQVHPDNTDLAVRAARALRLDLAGIDLLIPDIRRSWHETGAAICEVNAQPQLGITTSSHLYGEILQKLLPEGGRIPIVAILGAAPDDTLVADLATHFAATGKRTGWSDGKGVYSNGRMIAAAGTGSYSAGQMLLRDPTVEAIVLSIQDDQPLHLGLPFDRFDLLILAGRHIESALPRQPGHPSILLRALLATMQPACAGQLLPMAGTDVLWDEYLPTGMKLEAPALPGQALGIAMELLKRQ